MFISGYLRHISSKFSFMWPLSWSYSFHCMYFSCLILCPSNILSKSSPLSYFPWFCWIAKWQDTYIHFFRPLTLFTIKHLYFFRWHYLFLRDFSKVVVTRVAELHAGGIMEWLAFLSIENRELVQSFFRLVKTR